MKQIFIILGLVSVLSSCTSKPKSYVENTEYKINKPMVFNDFIITWIAEGEYSETKTGQIHSFRKFNITTPEESFDIYYQSHMHDESLPFATGGMESSIILDHSNKSVEDNYMFITWPRTAETSNMAFFDQFYNLLRENQQNQRVDLTVKTPVD